MASTHQLKIQDIFSVKDYVCLITGGGTGIGLMATQALAANGVSFCPIAIQIPPRSHSLIGARVYITGRRMEVLENAAKSHDPEGGGKIIPYASQRKDCAVL